MPTVRSAAVLVAICACGSSASPRDAPADIDNGTCGSLVRFTGEYVDWDSGTAFCGIFDAQFQVEGTGVTATTAPNGRFDLCVPDEPVVLVDITPPADGSPCALPQSDPQPTYTLPAIAVANKAVIEAGGAWSGRGFVTGRETVDLTKAQVFVHVNGTPRQLSLTAAHGPAQARVNGTWAAGDTGSEVFFPDVDPGSGTTTLSAGTAIGAGSIPVVAGKLTNLSIIGN